MRLTYDQKIEVIAYLSDPTNWHNRFPMSWFLDKTRRTRPPSNDFDLQSGRFFHTVPLNFPGYGGTFYWARINAAKLVISEDFGIEPGLMDSGVADHLITLTDTTEFKGYELPVPKKFAVEPAQDDFILVTTSDHKQTIINHGHILFEALKHQTPSKPLGFQNFKIDLLAASLQAGLSFPDRHDKSWCTAVIKHGAAAIFAKAMRKTLAHDFKLQAEQFVVVAVRPNAVVAAVEAEAFGNLVSAQKRDIDDLEAQFRL